ncbi:hypothetical protein [Ascidiimonas aurantiaca]|uniref:hypothetical protein n=1 Tax=Ascidiimonas aurantiaca TaxID=1685432 RepID=UPI0030ECF44F
MTILAIVLAEYALYTWLASQADFTNGMYNGALTILLFMLFFFKRVKAIINKYENNILIALFVIAFTSCKSQQHEYLQRLNNCIHKEVNLKIKKLYGIDSFEYYKLMEKVENEIFKKPNKRNYLKLIQEIQSGNFTKNLLVERGLDQMDKEGFFVSSHIVDILNNCPYKAFDRDRFRGVALQKRQRMMEQYYANPNEENNILLNYFDLTSTEEFKEIEFRSPILIMILANYLEEYPR